MLKKTEDKWEFESEAVLESFVWENLPNLFNLEPLKRQHIVMGEWCDILGVSEVGQLAILELKNIEDRYVVQQLTRYYENVLAEKPFSQKVDYQKLVRLVAIAPSFHRYNFIDLKYSKLNLEFWLFEIFQEGNQVYFYLKNIDGQILVKLKIPLSEKYVINPEKISNITLPRPPKALLDMLEKDGFEKQSIILNLRKKILKFDKRIGEKTTAVTIAYGRKRGTSICKNPETRSAEFYRETHNIFLNQNNLNDPEIKVVVKTTDLFDRPLAEPEYSYYKIITNINFFLYLPFLKDDFSQRIIKVLIKTDDWLTVQKIVLPHRYKEPWQAGAYWETEQYLKLYEKLTGKIVTSNSLDTLVDIALEEWRKRQ